MTLNRLVAIAATVVVICVGLVGLYLSGSPAEQRLLRLDERRVRDLNQLANATQRYWQEQGELPATLQQLVDGRRLNKLPVDPDSGQAYEYTAGDKKFTLCAEFSRATEDATTIEFWQHPAGQHCFDFDTTVIMPPGRMNAIGAVPLNR
ncbi:MAG: hypothetical protein JSV45_05550 [Chromatiales bacterium]|nr:MAG: hypothetical protein JSV45_05550 [Chromatiales bacterium]